MLTTTNSAAILTPEQVAALIVRPTIALAVATSVATLVTTGSKDFRVPIVAADPTAAWVAEGAEITPSDASLTEVVVTPAKLAGLTIISRELANDSSPAAAEVVGQGMARDLARRLDAAYFGALAAPAPSGLGALAGVSAVTAGAAWANLDAFAEALSAVEVAGSAVTAWVTNPATALALARLRDESGSNRPLLGTDPTMPTRRQVLGAPVYVSNGVAPNTVWGLPLDRTMLVMREDATLDVDGSPFFTSDRVAIRGTMRVGFGYPHPAALAKITITPV